MKKTLVSIAKYNLLDSTFWILASISFTDDGKGICQDDANEDDVEGRT